MKKKLEELLIQARHFGLNERDCNSAYELLSNREFGECFDVVVTQVYEYDLIINNHFYTLVAQIGNELKISQSNFTFLKELIKDQQ